MNRPGRGWFRRFRRTLMMFCGLAGVSRSFDARKREAVMES